MAKADIWMPIYIGDYLSDTMHLTTEQHGAYLLILMYGWRNGGKIPADNTLLASISRLSPEAWKNNLEITSGFFDLVDGYWIQKRQTVELSRAASRQERSKSNGIKGGRPKITQNEPRANLEITQSITQNEPRTNPEHNLNESSLQLDLKDQDLVREREKERDTHQKETFDQARLAYCGTKRGLEPEYADFKKKHGSGEEAKKIIEQLLPAVLGYKFFLIKKNGNFNFAKNFKTWINQSCWTEIHSNPNATPVTNHLNSTEKKVPYTPLY